MDSLGKVHLFHPGVVLEIIACFFVVRMKRVCNI